MAITIHELAVHRGLKTSDDGSYSMGDINAVGLEMLGGCEICGASIACYNACPSKSGQWRCDDCIGDTGWETVEEANRAIFGAEPKAEERSPLEVFNDREIATILHGLRMIQCEGRIEGCAAGDCEHFDDVEALTTEEIDALCERLNYGVEVKSSEPETNKVPHICFSDARTWQDGKRHCQKCDKPMEFGQ